jgi:orotidine-5'-phosphate decarboxylase
VRAGWRARGGRTVAPIIVSSSRAVIYASRGDNFAQAARDAALAARLELNTARADMR